MKEDAHREEGIASPIPAPVKGEVRRERLLTRLTAAMDEPWTLTLVGAPAGAGKTRLLAQWARELQETSDIAVVWVPLERGDDIETLVTALEGIDDPRVHRALRRVPRASGTAFARGLARALDAARGRIVIIVDDVHHLQDEETARLMSVFVQTVPGNVHVVLAGRGTRTIPLARRRLTGIALELDGASLAFRPHEIQAFFAIRGVEITPTEIIALLERTEGWAAALQLTMLNSSGGARIGALPPRGDDPDVVDYFVEEIFGDLGDDVQSFLEATAIPDSFSTDLATVLSGSAQAGAVVDRLLRLNVLAGPDAADPPRYHYHPLLREFLLGRLRSRGDGEAARLEGIASQWFDERGEPLLALCHAVRSEEEFCVSAILCRSGMQLVLDGHADEVVAAIGQLPAHRRADPAVRMLVAAAELTRGDASAAAVALTLRPDPGESEAHRRWRLGLMFHTALRRGGIEHALAAVDAEPLAPTGEQQIDTYALVQLAMVQLFAGRLDHAEESARRAADLARDIGAAAAELQAEAVLVTATLFRGRLRDVLDGCAAVVARWREVGEPDNAFVEVMRVWQAWVPYEAMNLLDASPALLPVARILDAGGETAITRGLHGLQALLAVDLNDDAHAAAVALFDFLAPRADLPLPVHWYAMMAPFVVHAFHRLNEPALRDRFIEEVEAALGETGDVLVLRALAAMHDRRPGIARGALAPVLEGGAPCLLPASMIDAWLVEAQLDVADGEPDRAQLALASALALAEPEDHVRRVAEAGSVVIQLLAARATVGSRTRFADRVRERFTAAGVLAEEELTQRERIVLAALCRNATLREIATQEYISPNTVKTHVRNIYRKLGVSDREGVTAAARALGLHADAP
ncbi:LuxR C-terminal-related transcriptional regulator [Microbacterium paraoxydans]|uniref:LuxR C-terminal-related transcriptional regulator n=1 Tax=Microbacterium paraoxydans TaxID=199592 RepID=UPI003D732C47